MIVELDRIFSMILGTIFILQKFLVIHNMQISDMEQIIGKISIIFTNIVEVIAYTRILRFLDEQYTKDI